MSLGLRLRLRIGLGLGVQIFIDTLCEEHGRCERVKREVSRIWSARGVRGGRDDEGWLTLPQRVVGRGVA